MNHISVGTLTPEHHNYTENGKCSNCGACCSNTLPLDKKEIKQIKKYIEKNNIKPINHVPAMMSKEYLDGICPFRDNINETCTIYPVRPVICRTYKCDLPVSDIQKNTEKLRHKKGKMFPYDVRATFFGDGTFGLDCIATLIAGQLENQERLTIKSQEVGKKKIPYM